MKRISRLPSVCQRCYQQVSRLARTCPKCGEPLERIDIFQVAYILTGSLAVFALLATAAVLVYRFYLNSE